MKLIKTVVTAVLAAATLPAAAGSPYVLGAVGRASFDVGAGNFDTSLAGAGATGIASSFDDTDTAYKLQLGYQFNPNFAIEGGWVDLGRGVYSGSYIGGTAGGRWKASGWNLAALGIMPLGPSFSLFAKAGTIDAKVERSLNASGPAAAASGSVSSTDWKANYGVGAMYSVNPKLGLRLEWERFHDLGNGPAGQGNVDLWSVGVAYKF